MDHDFQAENLLLKDRVKELEEKQEQTMLLVYGFPCANQSEVVKQKIRETNMERYGFSYGLSNKDVIAKREKTNLERYGAKNPLQRPEIQKKVQESSFRLKDYIFPSGNVVQVQGYEPFALNDLLKIYKINENDIVVGATNVPPISYYDSNNIERKHFVDIFLPKQNKCIEIKSTYTFDLETEKILLKQKYAKEAGYDYEIWIYGKKGNKIEEKC